MQLLLYIIILLHFCSTVSYGQITNPQAPQYEKFKPIQLNGNQPIHKPTSKNQYQNRPQLGLTAEDVIRQQNIETQRLMMEPGSKNREDRQKESLKIVQALLEEEKEEQNKQNARKQATKAIESLYVQSAQSICSMLWRKEKVSLKKAVWLAESAYLRGQNSYEKYNAQIDEVILFCEKYAKEQQLDWTKHDHRVKVLVDYFTKTIRLRSGEMHKRIMYDFQDPYGRQSYKQLMVSKLLETNKGQCHSMPLLFKILAEEIDIRAYICLSPAHSYIKIFFEDGRQPVFETTNGSLTGDNWIALSNVVPFTALRSGIYLDTLSEKETLIHCLNHLALSYEAEFGYKRFVYEVAEVAIEETPKYPPAWALFSNYVTYTTMEALKELNYPKLEELENYPVLKGRLELMYQIYADMDRMGYKNLEETEYVNWLKNNQEAIKKYQLEDY